MRNRNHVRLSSEGFSFHTLEFRYSGFNNRGFETVLKRLKCMSKRDQFYEMSEYGEDRYFCGCFSKWGIRVYLTKLDKWNVVKLVVNPRRLIDPKCSYLGIMRTDEKSLDEMEHRFTDLMRKAGLPDCIDSWVLTRVDLCVNFIFDRKKLPRQIIQLISRGPVPKGYERSTYTTPPFKTTKGTISLEKHSVKLSNKSIALVAYDKAYQLHVENLALPDEFIKRGILRLELQLGHDWILEKADKHDLKGVREKIDFLIERSQKYIKKYAHKLLLSGEYCQIQILKNRICAADDISEKVKGRLCRFVDTLSNDNICFDEGINRIAKELTEKQLRTLMDHYEALGLCPVPLNKDCKLKSVLSIPAILKVMDDNSLDMRFSTRNKAVPFKVCTE